VKIPHLIFIALLTIFTQLHAQETAARTCRILFLDRPQDAPKTLHLFDGTSSQEVALPSMNLSPLYRLAPGAIQLKLLSEKAEDPKAAFPDAPNVEIPADWNDFYLLVTSDTENKITPVKLKAINAEGENFKLGKTLWMNLSDKTIQAILGEHEILLEPDSSKIVDNPLSQSTPSSGYYNASFTYQIQDDGKFEPITEQQWWHDANSRHLGFMLNSGGKLPKIYFLRDFRNE
jgi:hypothetical protein